MEFDKEKIIEGLDVYIKIRMEMMLKNVYTDLEFRKMFESYFNINKSQKIKDIFFNYLEKNKRIPKMFSTLIEKFYSETGEVDYYLCSVILSVTEKFAPVLDRYILNQFGFVELDEKYSDKEKIKYYIDAYYHIVNLYRLLISYSDYIKKYIDYFNHKISEYKFISNEKKIECLLKSYGKKCSFSYFEYIQCLDIIFSLLTRKDIPFDQWIKQIEIKARTPVTGMISSELDKNLYDISPFMFKELVKYYEEGMSPLDALCIMA